MNNADLEYQRLLKLILDKGRVKQNRTGVNTIGVFGAQARFNLAEGFPLLTTKKMFYKGVIHELLWFIKGDTNIKYLVDNGVNIWNKDAYRAYLKADKKPWDFKDGKSIPFSEEEFIDFLKTCEGDNSGFVKWGELGEGTYGGMWRGFPYYKMVKDNRPHGIGFDIQEGRVDQLAKAIEKLKNNPDDRRIIVNSWHPYWVDHCVLPPCHVLFHFNTEELTTSERSEISYRLHGPPPFFGSQPDSYPQYDAWFDSKGVPRRRLNCLMYQRSCDTFLGVPFNIASYALLTEMVAHCVNMVAGEFIHTYGDLHLYENHIEQAKEQLVREPMKLPKLKLNPNIKDLFTFKYEDIAIEGYESHPAIKGEMST